MPLLVLMPLPVLAVVMVVAVVGDMASSIMDMGTPMLMLMLMPGVIERMMGLETMHEKGGLERHDEEAWGVDKVGIYRDGVPRSWAVIV
jgi:hypothetical protein